MLKSARRFNPFLLMGSLMVVALLMVAACGGDDAPAPVAPAAPAIDETALSNLVQNAVQQAQASQPEGLTAAQVQGIVSNAISSVETPEGLTAMQVQDIVNSALAAAETPEGLTAMEVQEIVTMALAESMVEEEKGTIVFATLNWSSAEVQSALGQYIVEHGYGYPVDERAGSTIPLFQGLLRGDVDVTLEIWLPNQNSVWLPALDAGDVIPVGNSLDEQWQSSFVIPTSFAERFPDLKHVDDLKDYVDEFDTEDGKIKLWTCPGSWACSAVNERQVAAYGLEDVVILKPAEGGGPLFASLQGAYDKEEAWLGYMWAPSVPANTLDLTRLEEPAVCEDNDPEDADCAYGVGPVRIAVHPTMVQRAPDVVEMLRLWSFTDPQIGEVLQYRSQTDSSAQEAAVWFLTNREAVWTPWVPRDVADRVRAALSSG